MTITASKNDTTSKPAGTGKIAGAMRYFGQRPASFPGGGGISGFRNEWAQLTPDDKTQLTSGISGGTLTY